MIVRLRASHKNRVNFVCGLMVAELGIGLDKTGVHFVGSSRIGLRCGLDSCKTASSRNSRLRSSVAPTRCLICTRSGAVFTSKKTLIFPQNLENKESEVFGTR